MHARPAVGLRGYFISFSWALIVHRKGTRALILDDKEGRMGSLKSEGESKNCTPDKSGSHLGPLPERQVCWAKTAAVALFRFPELLSQPLPAPHPSPDQMLHAQGQQDPAGFSEGNKVPRSLAFGPAQPLQSASLTLNAASTARLLTVPTCAASSTNTAARA